MTIAIPSSDPWYSTKFVLKAGTTYRFSAQGEWIDGNIKYGPDGGPSGSNFFLRISEGLRRRSNDNWFALIGGIDADQSTTFLIGSSLPSYTAPKTGQLTYYANDVSLFYFNNKGSIVLTIDEIR